MVGVDPDIDRIKVAKKQFINFRNLTFTSAKSINFPVDENNPFDYAICNVVLHWIPTNEKVATFKRIHSSLKPGGLFVGNISFKTSKNLDLAVSLLTKEDQEKVLSNYYRESPSKLQEMIMEAGFRLLKYEHRYKEVKMGTVNNFLTWVTALYGGKYDFKAIYDKSDAKVKFEIYPDGSVKHTSEGVTFIAMKPFL